MNGWFKVAVVVLVVAMITFPLGGLIDGLISNATSKVVMKRTGFDTERVAYAPLGTYPLLFPVGDTIPIVGREDGSPTRPVIEESIDPIFVDGPAIFLDGQIDITPLRHGTRRFIRRADITFVPDPERIPAFAESLRPFLESARKGGSSVESALEVTQAPDGLTRVRFLGPQSLPEFFSSPQDEERAKEEGFERWAEYEYLVDSGEVVRFSVSAYGPKVRRGPFGFATLALLIAGTVLAVVVARR